MNRTLLLLAAVLIFLSPLRAEEQVRAVQEELRRRNIYFGDVDGRRTPELEQAVKRYQRRKGFSSSGTEDQDTLRSLGVVARSPDEAPPKEIEWPAEPVLRSDTTINVPVVAELVAQEAGVAPESVAPIVFADAKGRPIPVSKLSRKQKAVVAAQQKTAARRAAAAPAPAPTSGRRSRASARALATDQRISPNEVRDFVKDYFKAVSSDDTQEELEFYSDRVDYFHNGLVDRRIIERTLRDYAVRWPNRKYSVGDVINYRNVPSRGEIVVTFEIDFSLKGNGKKVKGQTANTITINAATSDPRIVSIQEQRIRG